jgi:DNA-binding LacI/PurR family transcriptional regulator
MKRRITIKDIAEVAGVSPTTVSFCLNDTGRVSPETKRKVLRIARDLKYAPNLSARELVGKKSGVIGVVVPHFREPKIDALLQAVEKKAHEYGYYALVSFTDEQVERERCYLSILDGKNIDGLIIYPVVETHKESNHESLVTLSERGVPVICVDRYFEESELPYVVTENYLAAFMGTEYLIKSGHTRIGFIGGIYHSVGRERFKGFKDALAKYGLSADSLPVYVSCQLRDRENDIDEVVDSFFLEHGLTSIVAYNSLSANAVVRKFAGYKPSSNLPFEVIGFDMLRSTAGKDICVYSFHQAHDVIGAMALDLLVQLI